MYPSKYAVTIAAPAADHQEIEILRSSGSIMQLCAEAERFSSPNERARQRKLYLDINRAATKMRHGIAQRPDDARPCNLKPEQREMRKTSAWDYFAF
jgi:hypothetical protein